MPAPLKTPEAARAELDAPTQGRDSGVSAPTNKRRRNRQRQRRHRHVRFHATPGMMRIADIKIGRRHRSDLGDILALARNIDEVGLLHPIVVTPAGGLVAGARRIAAFRYLGRDWIQVTVIDIKKVALGEYAENTFRKAFTPSEMVDIADTIEPIERARAKERQGERIDKHPGKFPGSSKGRALDKVAKIVGKDRRTLEKARGVRDAARAEPDKFGKLLEQMDGTGRVNGVYRRLKIAKQAELIRSEPPPLPGNGPYRVASIDLPWPYEVRSEDPSKRGVRPYPTMSIEQMWVLPVASIMHEDSILWMWTTNAFMRDAYTVLDAYGFKAKTILTWVKDKMGPGDWLRGQTEHAIMAVRGKPTVELTNQTTVLYAPARAHSQKPPEFYDLVESLCPAPRYADLFSRYQHNERWDCHGDQAPQMEAAE
jgi:N6-adenosine-specific RNA methylase IME4